MKEGGFRLDMRKICFVRRVVRLSQVAERSCASPIPGNVHAHIGQGFEQPDLVKDISGHGTVVGRNNL